MIIVPGRKKKKGVLPYVKVGDEIVISAARMEHIQIGLLMKKIVELFGAEESQDPFTEGQPAAENSNVRDDGDGRSPLAIEIRLFPVVMAEAGEVATRLSLRKGRREVEEVVVEPQ